MNLDRKSLSWTFILTLSLTLWTFPFFPNLRLFFFVPFLIIAYYQKSFIKCLWLSLFCGLIIDMLSSQLRFGTNALNYCLTTLILYPQRYNFFADSKSTLPLMTFFFSLLSSLIQVVLIYIFDQGFPISASWIFNDLLLLPLADAAFAFGCFVLPFALFGKRPRTGKDYFSSSL